MFDDINIFKAQVEFKNKDYEKSLSYYKKVKSKNDEVYFNIANILYKQKRYKQAIDYYKKISKIQLTYKKLHNIGNSYIALGDIQNAINFYESALKFQNNSNTIYNLNLSNEIKVLQEKELKDKNIDEVSFLRDTNRNLDIQKDSYKMEKMTQNEEDKVIIERRDNISNLKLKSIKEEIKIAQFEEKDTIRDDNKPLFSTLEERKYDKSLNNRKLNSLLIPLENKGRIDDKYPW